MEAIFPVGGRRRSEFVTVFPVRTSCSAAVTSAGLLLGRFLEQLAGESFTADSVLSSDSLYRRSAGVLSQATASRRDRCPPCHDGTGKGGPGTAGEKTDRYWPGHRPVGTARAAAAWSRRLRRARNCSWQTLLSASDLEKPFLVSASVWKSSHRRRYHRSLSSKQYSVWLWLPGRLRQQSFFQSVSGARRAAIAPSGPVRHARRSSSRFTRWQWRLAVVGVAYHRMALALMRHVGSSNKPSVRRQCSGCGVKNCHQISCHVTARCQQSGL